MYKRQTPTGKKEVSKNIDFMLLHTPLAYQATASVGNIRDFKRKLAKAATKDGPCFIHVLTQMCIRDSHIAVTVICGIHYEAPGKDGLAEIVACTERLLQDILTETK